MQHDGVRSTITPRTRARARHIPDHYFIGHASLAILPIVKVSR